MREPQTHRYFVSIKWIVKALMNQTLGLNFLTSPQNAALPVGNQRDILMIFKRTFLELLEP